MASLEARPQALSSLLPQLSGTGSWGHDDLSSTSPYFTGSTFFPLATDTKSTNKQWALQLKQTVFRWDQFATLKQADAQVAQAEVDYRAAQQSLIVRDRDGLLQRARRARHARRRRGVPRGDRAAARAGREALRGRPDRDHRRRGGQGRQRPGDRDGDQRQAHARHLARPAARSDRRQLRRAGATGRRHAARDARPGERGPVGARPRSTRTCRCPRRGSRPTSPARTSRSPAPATCRRSTWWRAVRSSTRRRRPRRRSLPGDPTFGEQFTYPRPTRNNDKTIALQLTVPIYSGGYASSKVRQAVYRHRAARERLENTARATERDDAGCLPRRDRRDLARTGAQAGARLQQDGAQRDRGRLRGRHAHRGGRAARAPAAAGRADQLRPRAATTT